MGIDVEEWGNPAEYPTEIVRERLRTMIALLQASGQRVIVYTNKQGHSRFVREAFAVAERPEVWICSFTDPPLSREPWMIWQHSHIGRLPGVKGAVDLNIFNGDSLQWLEWLGKGQ